MSPFRNGKRRAAIIAVAAVAALGVSTLGVASAGAETSEGGVETQAKVKGVDVSAHQGKVNWSKVKKHGIDFAYVKATEGSTYKNPDFKQQYGGAKKVGLIRGAYHFANPAGASGAAQAKYFVKNGGDWSKGGKTLPGVLDIEWNPYDGGACYGVGKKAMVNWIGDFVGKYKKLTGRYPVIYTAASWWNDCTGGSKAFKGKTPLWVAHYGVNSPDIPKGFGKHTVWQYTSEGKVPGIKGNADLNNFRGSKDKLRSFAKG